MRARRSPFDGVGTPVALAHRGGAGEAPENTWTAFRHAHALGYRAQETDVRATRDGVVVVFHDATLDRTTDATGPIADRTWADLSAVRGGDGGPLVRLDELLEEWPDRVWNVDVKCADVVDPFLATVRRAGAADRVCVASFSGRRLARVRRHAGPALATSASPAEAARVVAAARGLPRRWAATGAVAVQVPETRGRWRLVDRSFVTTAHALGLQVHIWTVDDPAAMARLLELGVDGIMTDRPSVLREVLTERGDWRG